MKEKRVIMDRVKEKIVEEYWLKKLSGELPKASLLLIAAGNERKAGAREAKQVQHHLQEIPTTVSTKLIKAARNSDMALFILVLSGLNIVLARYTGTDDLVVGTLSPAVNENDNLIIFCRSQLPGAVTVREFIKQTKEEVLTAINYSGYHPDDLVGMLKVRNNTDSIDIFNAAFIYEPLQKKNQYLDRFELVFILSVHNDRLHLRVDYPSIAGVREIVETFNQNLLTTLERMVENPAQEIYRLDIVSPEERERLLYDFNNTPAVYPKNKTIHQLFEDQAKETPDNIAVIGEMQSAGRETQNRERDKENHAPCVMRGVLTYRELHEKSNRLAYLLRKSGVEPDAIVGLMVERSIEMITALLAILKAGGAYLPIDPGYPEERKQYMLKDSGAKILLTGQEMAGLYSPSHLHLSPAPTSAVSSSSTLTCQVSPANLAYIIYTSGSTGRPKGVMVEHRHVVAYLEAFYNELPVSSTDIVIQQASYTFDAFVEEVYPILLAGGQLLIARKDEVMDLQRLSGIIARHHVNIISCSPLLLNELNRPDRIEEIKSINIFISGGDVLRKSYIDNLLTIGKVYNTYGPSETTVCVTYYQCSPQDEDKILIGKPIANYQVYILDKYHRLLPISVPGELCVSGAAVTRGYLNRPGLTAEKFEHDFWDYRDKVKKQKVPLKGIKGIPQRGYHRSHRSHRSYIYQTGDLARWLPEGNIEFLGRLDQQVKIRGFRIELEEIEIQLVKHDKVKAAVVITREDKEADKYLCAYIVPTVPGIESFDLAAFWRQLKEYLSHTLPAYMIPAHFVLLEEIPLTPSGKIDRRGLPGPGMNSAEPYQPPRDKIEERLAQLWSDILGIEPAVIGIDSNFFALGGHSLKATVLVSRIHKEFHVKIPLDQVFKAPFIRKLGQYIKQGIREDFSSILPAEQKDCCPLSSAQKRLYILHQMDPASTVYNLPFALVLEGKLEEIKLQDTFRKLIHRHESLRTSFHMIVDEPVQKVHRDAEFKIEDDWSLVNGHWSLVNCQSRGEVPSPVKVEKIIRDFIRPFDLTQAPLLRVGLTGPLHTPSAPRGHHSQEGKENQYLLMVDMHHIISDGVSMDSCIRDFISLYTGEVLPSLRLQYKDFSQWQNGNKEKESIKRQELYWLKEFAGEIPVLELPLDYARPAVRGFEGNSLHFEINRDITGALGALALETGTTLFMVLLSIYSVFLSKISGTEEIVIGTPLAGRNHADLEKIIGMFVNTLALRSYPSGEKQFTGFLAEVKEKIWEAFENQDYQYEKLVDQLSISGNPGRNPLFDVVFVLQNMFHSPADKPKKKIQGLKIKPYPYEHKISKFDLTLSSVESEDGERLYFTVEYSCKLFKEETIARFIQYFKKIISAVIEAPAKKIWEIDILPKEEKERLLVEFNDTRAAYPQNKTIHRLFEEQAEQTPDGIALLGASGGQGAFLKNRPLDPQKTFYYLTYHELDENSYRLARMLMEKGVRPDSIVGIMMEPSVDMIIGILGILKAGGAYLPLDPDYPEERKQYMLDDSAAKILLTSDAINHVPTPQCLSFHPSDRPSLSTSTSTCQVGFTNLAYIIYTSGTTGRPKGAAIQHGNVVRLLFNDKFPFDFSTGDTWTLFHSYCFDFSVWEMYGALLYGGKLVIIPKALARDTGGYLERLKKEKVTIINQTPSAFYNLMHLELTETKKELYIRWIIFGGESLTPSRLKNWKVRYPLTRLINMYGITETTVHVTFKEIKDIDIESAANNIGKPLPTLSIYVMDKVLGLLPAGIAGELCVGGKGVGRGYLNRPGLTANKFVTNPYAPAERFYRSGDLGRINAAGEIEYLGRIDNQVKIRGFRIELGEIEIPLMRHRDIKETVVLAKTGKNGDSYLCAYIVSHRELPTSELKQYLLKYLPGYMVPAYFVHLERIPLTPNGKLDGKALPEPGMETDEGQKYQGPTTETEKKLALLWQEVLGIEKNTISVDANFFEIGGHSLKAAILVSKLHKEFNVKIPLAEVFRTPFIRALARYIMKAGKDWHAAVEPVEKKEYYGLSPAQKRLYFLQQLDLENTGYNMPYVLALGKDIEKNKLESTLKKIIARHESLRTSFLPVNDTPVQRVHDYEDIEFALEYYEIAAETHHSSSASGIQEPLIRFFDLSGAPLMRSCLIRHAGAHYTWIVDMHHIISDGTSLEILTRDFLSMYNGEELEPLRLQYKDYSLWRERLAAGGEIKVQEEYWLELYADAPSITRLDLPVDYERPGVFSFEGDTHGFVLEREDGDKFKALAAGNNGTLYMNVLAALNTLFYRYTGQEDIIIGSGIAGRPHDDLQHIIGMFVNTLAMRNYPHGKKSYESFLKEVMAQSVKAFENQDVQFEDLVDNVHVQRDASRNPLFDITMVVHNFREIGRHHQLEIPPRDPGNLPAINYKNQTAKFDMTFFVQEIAGHIHINIEYYTAIFKQETIARLARHFKKVVKEVTANPRIKLKDIDLLTQQDKHQLLIQFSGSGDPAPWSCPGYPGEKTIVGLFKRQVEQTPDAAAVVLGSRILSRGELDERSDRLANYLIAEQHIKPDAPVGILMEKSPELITAILGVLKAGGAYLPLDPDLPRERIKLIIDDSRPGFVCSQKKFIKMLNQLQWECESFHTFLCMDSRDIYREDENESGLTDQKLWDYVAESAVDEITGGGWLTGYTGEPFTREEMAEYGDNALKKLAPILHRQMRVLEIGCASGLTMYRLAPRVGYYLGTDLSPVTIEKNKKRVKEEGHRNIELACLSAHEIDRIEGKNFDLIVINSVIQAFPGHNYLGKVIGKAIDLLADRGYLFIGDVMDQDLKDRLIRDMIRFKYTRQSGKTKTDWSEELFISRGFFRDLSTRFPGISSIEFSEKIHTIENELTKFRYDTLIKIDKTRKEKPLPGVKQKHQHDGRVLEKYRYPGTRPVLPVTVTPRNLAYLMYTSGSTGRPKGVPVEHRQVVRLVKGSNFIDFAPGDRLLLTGAVVFDITTFEIWGALLNGLGLYLLNKTQLLDMEELKNEIIKNNISVLHLIPQLFNQALDQYPGMFAGLKYFLVGGDLVRPGTINRLRNGCPGIKILHMYGPTENTTFSTYLPVEKDYHQRIPLGKPISGTQVYILSNYGRLQPIGAAGELCTGGDGVARGYLNKPELTAEKFISSNRYISYRSYTSYISKKIYKTGDLARWLPDGNIEFLGRIDRQVKIRGIRMELPEIENRLLKHEGIKEAVVIDRELEDGEKHLCAYIAAGNRRGHTGSGELDLSGLKKYLALGLPEYMIPSRFVFLDRIPLTPNGKIDWKGLPEPGVIVGNDYAAPVDEIEKRLVGIWSEVLGIVGEKLSRDTNFFDIGGHSLKASILTTKIHKEMNVKIPLAEIFRIPFIKGLADYIRKAVKEEYMAIEPVEKKQYYDVSHAQNRLWILDRIEPERIAYNMPGHVEFRELNREAFEKVIHALIKRHEILRTTFITLHGEPKQKINEGEPPDSRVEYKDLRKEKNKAGTVAILKEKEIKTPFDLEKGPLLRTMLLHIEENRYLFLYTMHHIISDGWSMEVMEREFRLLYDSFVNGKGNPLPPLPIQYKDYTRWHTGQLTGENLKKHQNYWFNQFKGEIPVLDLPTDYPRPELRSFKGEFILFSLNREVTEQLKGIGRAFNTTLFITLLAVVKIFLYRYTGQEDIIVGTVIAGREHKDLENQIGFYVNMLALRSRLKGDLTFKEILPTVNRNTLMAFEHQAYPFDRLVHELKAVKDLRRNPLCDVVVAFQTGSSHPGEEYNDDDIPESGIEAGKHDLRLRFIDEGSRIMVHLLYNPQLFKKERIMVMKQRLISLITDIIHHPEKKIHHLNFVTEIETRLPTKKFEGGL